MSNKQRQALNMLQNYIEWYKTWKAIPVVAWVRAAENFKQGKFQEARELYLKGLNKNQKHIASYCARLDLAHCHFRLGEFAKATDQLRQVMHQIPNLKEAYIRMARMQMWTGEYMEAVWTMRKALRELEHDSELVALFLTSVLENNGPGYLLDEGEEAYKSLSEEEKQNEKLEVAVARLEIYRGDYRKGRSRLSTLASGSSAPFEAVVAYGEILLKEGRVSIARQQLRRALIVAPNHPKVLSLFAWTYLKSGPYYNADFAKQTAISAAQHSGWRSPEALHVLAESYYALGDNITALATAVSAKEAGGKLLSHYKDARSIDMLIESISAEAEQKSAS
ncbi:MAG: tetratricopeptide repeat protein [Deltaproteobacteria bacterium]|nr:tetratricopeptide repeat protein [Deltaproteobacteria bacterium]